MVGSWIVRNKKNSGYLVEKKEGGGRERKKR